MYRKALFLYIIFLSGTVNADVYKCKDANGHILYQALPCQTADQTVWEKRQRSVKPNDKDWQITETTPAIKHGILAYLNRVLKDPDSVKDLAWEHTATDGNVYRTMVFFRAKNSWGAYGISRYIFTTDNDGKYIDKIDLTD